jgi:ADP-ribose pyrophosphatase YjhB (NUDIX family)
LKREYPDRPFAGVGAVLVRNGDILLVKRGSDPGRGKWTVPGGLVELGETVEDAVIREVKEECNLDVEVHSLIDVVDNLIQDEKGGLQYHFIIVDYFVHIKGENTPHAGSDILTMKWVPLAEARSMELTQVFREFLDRNWKILQQR